MNKLLPYGLAAIVVLALGILLVSSSKKQPRKLDERITLRQKDKIPYGLYAAKNLLPSVFPNTTIYNDKRSPGYWDSLSLTAANQGVVLIANTLNANETELENLLNFVRKGNYVFIITKNMSYEANNFFGLNSGDIYSEDGLKAETTDSLEVKLSFPHFDDETTYTYPGKRHAAYYSNWDKEKAIVLGTNSSGYPNFLRFNAGEGSFFIHTAPLSFSNYFVLHKSNFRYLEQAFSVFPHSVQKIVWSEYYLSKRNESKVEDPNWLGVLFRYPSFKWALLTAVFTLLLFVLMEMRRKQRIVPIIQSPKNDSLDFVQTIGRLYYDKKDHSDLARKMSIYFLDFVRTQYKLPTHTLDESFINALHVKSGYPIQEIKNIKDFIVFANEADSINENQLIDFHKQLESFYQNT